VTVREKLEHFDRIARKCGWPEVMRNLGREKVRDGHNAHDDADRICPEYEALTEAIDIGGYAAIARAKGEWRWEWAFGCILAGVIGRLLCHIVRRRHGWRIRHA